MMKTQKITCRRNGRKRDWREKTRKQKNDEEQKSRKLKLEHDERRRVDPDKESI